MTTLETMYSGVAGSPETILTVQYVAGTSATITVEDASVLPDAPNRVVIKRTDLAFVTVHYGSLTGNVLGSLTVEAGFTGTFPIGSSVARRFCEGDHKELRDNIAILQSNIDTVEISADQVVSGVLDIARIPSVALETVVTVADDAARYALSSAEVSIGDSVKVLSTNKLWLVVDLDNLDSEAGYIQYTALPTPHAGTHETGGTDAISDASTTISGLMAFADKVRLDGIEDNAEVNVIEEVKVGGTALTVTSKSVDVPKSSSSVLGVVKVDGTTITADANAVISAKLQNKNILHNWDFRNPVNQRGQSSYPSTGYTIDRWRLITTYGSNVLTVEDKFVKLTAAADTTTRSACISQILDNNLLPYVGKTFTLSFNVSAYTGSWGFRVRLLNGGTYLNQASADISSTGITSVAFTIPDTCDTLMIELQTVSILAGDYIGLFGAKLELGSVSTLANDPPADYGEQLARCKRYYRLWTTEAGRTAALLEVGLMRLASPTVGTVVIGGTTYYYASADL